LTFDLLWFIVIAPQSLHVPQALSVFCCQSLVFYAVILNTFIFTLPLGWTGLS